MEAHAAPDDLANTVTALERQKRALVDQCKHVIDACTKWRRLIGKVKPRVAQLRDQLDIAKDLLRTWIGEEGTTGSCVDQLNADLESANEAYRKLWDEHQTLARGKA
jgi:hypothetical protein